MLDIQLFRDNPELIKENLKKKFQVDKSQLVDEVIKLDTEWKVLKKESDDLRFERNKLSQEINIAKKEGKDIEPILEQVKSIPDKISKIEDKIKVILGKINKNLMTIPNIIDEQVPIGKDESENVEINKYGTIPKFDFDIKGHVELAEELNIADFETSATVAGNGFYYLKGDLALLNQALLRLGVDFITKRGYTLIEPPLMTRKEILEGVVDMDFFDELVYKIQDEDLYLIATSEHPLIGMFTNKTIDESKLPIKISGISPCFRKEIGAHGIDEKGLFRTHQFNKVEQVVLCKPEDSQKIYDELMQNSIDLFNELEIPTRVLESCSGDLGTLKARGADLEAWSPRKNGYIEVCSVSNMTSAQARRLNIRASSKDKKYHVHTLNNTMIATSRAMVAILENFQNKDGGITIPKVLRPYMHGKTKIEISN